MCIRDRTGKLKNKQKQGACHNKYQPCGRFPGELFLEEQPGKRHSKQDTQLVNGSYQRSLASLQRPVITEPGQACGNAGKDQKEPAFRIDLPDPFLFPSGEYDDPGHEQHEDGSDRRTQVGIDVFDCLLYTSATPFTTVSMTNRTMVIRRLSAAVSRIWKEPGIF